MIGSEQTAPGDEPAGGGGPSPNGADPGGDVNAIYRAFLARAALLPPQAVGEAEMLLDEIASTLPPSTFKSLAAAIEKATGLDARELRNSLHKIHKAQNFEIDDPEGVEAFTDPAAAYEQCREIAEDPALLKRLLDIASRLGIAGDKRGVISTYLVAISRLLPDPTRMLRKGSPASGKNFAIDKLLPLFNPHDYVLFTAASAKALFYSPIDFRHKLLIIPEAAALVPSKNGSDEFAMIIRELISSGRLVYHTVQPVGPNKTLVGVVIEKEGPVALIMTTARNNIEEEMETRLLVAVTDESDSQTRNIIFTAADKAAGNGPQPVSEDELTRYRAYQDWLRLGERRVVVPFAPVIARLTDRRAMRIRRDFSAVLSLVKASALMHRAQRESDTEGRIVATSYDYELAVASLGEGLEELAHGETATIDAVRTAVSQALRSEQQKWRCDLFMVRFRDALVKTLMAAGHMRGVKQLSNARAASRGATVDDCLAIAASSGATVDRHATYRSAAAASCQDARKPDAARPRSVELSTNRLAVLLGIGRKVARGRLNVAIESGAVIDVGAGIPARSRTAPKLLAPGMPASPETDRPSGPWRIPVSI